MKKSVLTVLIVLCALLLASCCRHEVWNDANCELPKTCAECGETEGAPLGHSWAAATCTTPKTCTVCQKIEGEALGHNWADAACETPKTCQSCGLTEGEALGHTWEEATTEAPKTCSACSKTEGERIITDPRFTTAACKPFFGRWVFSLKITGDTMDLEGFSGYLDVNIYLEFSNDGALVMSADAKKCENFEVLLTKYMVDMFYAECAAQNIGKTEADAEILAAYEMTTEEYFAAVANSIDFEAQFNELRKDGFYYVDGDTLYIASEWEDDMEDHEFRFEGDALFLEDLTEDLGVPGGSFTRLPDEEV